MQADRTRHLGCRLALLVILLPIGGYTQAESSPPGADDEAWVSLFNGKDLQGWIPKITGHPAGNNHANTFRVERGLLRVRYDAYDSFNGQFGHLFYETPFSHYMLHIEYRFVGDQAPGGPQGWAERNSGVMLHAQSPHTMTEQQDFPVSIEAQFLGGLSDGQVRPTGNLCTPGTHVHFEGVLFTPHCKPSTSSTYHGDQWVSADFVVLGGGRMRHLINGEEVMSYHQPVIDGGGVDTANPHAHPSLNSGYIALQSESHPIDFRVIRILNLAGCTDPAAENYMPYAIKSEPDTCIRE